MRHLSYTERANYCLSPLAKRLLQLMDEKQTNLTISADVTSAQKLLELADQLGPEICMLKTHIDIISDFTPDLTHTLRKLAHQHHFLLFEDRKFADIGNTVKHQYEGGIYHIVDWADIINAHSLPGPGIVQGLAQVGRKKNRGLVLIAEMSSAGHFMNVDYIRSTLKMAEHTSDFVIGFITQHALSADPHWIHMTPGIKLETGKDALGQQYITPKKAILEHGTDIIIVGRGIIAATDPVAEARKYRESGWNAYLKRCEK
ncbi:orotidine-5'-phosphate decarboxylase [Aquicella lusitana]|uniref:Orotidine 5'-phosphate decarboxylase n=1 Tax=Aquicella lusitana TaxID=254246 RepID=A0A370GC67_9COXI|nr:orotidine-5'-phosphate decarboxylase [Aquicella lusitana]RDI41311.1 orotidine-5'-phosphate decarboxylase [Aquicella lusitana]VVC72322.1 Orotidine 5'-phosphate decarboxylase [Aquicella lusitana]